jgi:hypothetical protein
MTWRCCVMPDARLLWVGALPTPCGSSSRGARPSGGVLRVAASEACDGGRRARTTTVADASAAASRAAGCPTCPGAASLRSGRPTLDRRPPFLARHRPARFVSITAKPTAACGAPQKRPARGRTPALDDDRRADPTHRSQAAAAARWATARPLVGGYHRSAPPLGMRYPQRHLEWLLCEDVRRQGAEPPVEFLTLGEARPVVPRERAHWVGAAERGHWQPEVEPVVPLRRPHRCGAGVRETSC